MREIGCFVVGILGAVLLVVAGLTWVFNELSLPASLASIEQLRADSRGVDPAQAEGVIAQVTAWNQKIASNRAFNHIPLVGLVVPDAWDSVEPIPVPR